MIFKYLDYRPFIKDWVKNKKNLGKKFNYQNMAENIRMQKSYLSRILAGDGYLNQDQAFLLGKVMSLNTIEQNYLILLVEYDRTAVRERKQEILDQLKSIRQKQTNSDKVLAKSIHDNSIFAYYSNPLLQILHITLLTGDSDHKSLNQIKGQLGITDEVLHESIEKLKELNIISQKRKTFINEAKGMHLKHDNALTKMNLSLLRQYSISKMTNLPKDQSYSFSTTFSGNENTFIDIKAEFLNFLRHVEPSIDNAKSENSYQINFDLFPWILR